LTLSTSAAWALVGSCVVLDRSPGCAWSNRTPEKALDAQILVKVRPVDPLAITEQPPVLALSMLSV